MAGDRTQILMPSGQPLHWLSHLFPTLCLGFLFFKFRTLKGQSQNTDPFLINLKSLITQSYLRATFVFITKARFLWFTVICFQSLWHLRVSLPMGLKVCWPYDAFRPCFFTHGDRLDSRSSASLGPTSFCHWQAWYLVQSVLSLLKDCYKEERWSWWRLPWPSFSHAHLSCILVTTK